MHSKRQPDKQHARRCSFPKRNYPDIGNGSPPLREQSRDIGGLSSLGNQIFGKRASLLAIGQSVPD